MTSVMVDDQQKALDFYTEMLGFKKKRDVPLGEARWLTVTSPEGADDVELLLEPVEFAPAKTFQKALFDAGIPATAFEVIHTQPGSEQLKQRGVEGQTQPTQIAE